MISLASAARCASDGASAKCKERACSELWCGYGSAQDHDCARRTGFGVSARATRVAVCSQSWPMGRPLISGWSWQQASFRSLLSCLICRASRKYCFDSILSSTACCGSDRGSLARYPNRFFGDIVDHLRGPGFFTTVAGTASSVASASSSRQPSRWAVLWVVAIVLWIVLTYAIFAGFTIKEHKPPLDKGIGGAWLLAVVATQSIAVLAALLAPHIDSPASWR